MSNKFDDLYNKIISEMNLEIMKSAGFENEVEDVQNGICPACKKPVNPNSFKNALSQKEFKISGLCQACQDEIFGSDEDDEEYEEGIDYTENTIPEEPEDYRNDSYKNPNIVKQDETQIVQDETDIEDDQQYQDEETDEDYVECSACYEPTYIDDIHTCYDSETGEELSCCQNCYDGLVSSGKATPEQN